MGIRNHDGCTGSCGQQHHQGKERDQAREIHRFNYWVCLECMFMCLYTLYTK
jgi:hypothetical protein